MSLYSACIRCIVIIIIFVLNQWNGFFINKSRVFHFIFSVYCPFFGCIVFTNPVSHNAGKAVYISESGLYSLVLKSRLPAAKSFRKWVKTEFPRVKKVWKAWGLVQKEEDKIWKQVGIKLDADKKERFCVKDVYDILEFKNTNQTLLDRVKQAYKSDLRSLVVAGKVPANPVS